ncbi:hypothetical protein RGQ29_015129 [Quercus rubra]|uniref:Uncharacterized protein n=1 Tax=Quercus rubra TaxID=3512 RepID=A0AAN7J469_QUERU|nr:hypothetical protein RGQ29_015129 [Quercus rubra]
MVQTLALCHNAVNHANKTMHCKLLLSDKRWVPIIFTIKGGGSGSFVLKSNSNSSSDSPVRIRTAKYSIALQHLILEGITEESEQ